MQIQEEFALDPNLVLYLPLWKRDGATFVSDDARGYVCTVTGSLWTLQGRYFDGTDDIITAPDHSALGLTSQGTIEIWCKAQSMTQDDYATLVSKSNGGVAANIAYNLHWRAAGGANVIRGIISDGASIITINLSACPTDLGFHHHVFSWNGQTLNGYQDSQITATPVVQTINAQVNTVTLRIGDRGLTDLVVDGYAFNGIIAEVRIYNRALLPAEIQRNYEMTKWRYR